MASGGGYIFKTSLASYQDTRKFNVIEGTVKYTGGSGDLYIASYIDGVQTSGPFPDKLAYKFEHAECNNGAEIIFDNASWTGNVSNLNSAKTKCDVYFTTRDQANLISNKIKYLAESDKTNLVYDGTVEDSNLRYIGKNPNNYVTFNGEEWRIIGTFKNIDDGTGKLEWRTKIIKNESIGNKKWDAEDINDWTTSDLKDELNGAYLNGLSNAAYGMVGNTKWALGKVSTSYQNASVFYKEERNGLTWTGKIGLMYPSDYGYATGGSTRSTCLDTILYSWNSNSSCYSNDWLYKSGTIQWTITSFSTYQSAAAYVYNTGSVDGDSVTKLNAVRPVVYLSSSVQITGGSGRSTDPFILAI